MNQPTQLQPTPPARNQTMPRWAPRPHRPRPIRLPPPASLAPLAPLAPNAPAPIAIHPFDVAAMDDAALLAAVTGCPREAAQKWIAAAGSLVRLARFSIDDLVELAGISSAEATRVLAACEIGRRTVVREARPAGPIYGAAEIARWFKLRIGGQFVQDIWVVGLDDSQGMRGVCRVSHGDVHGNTLDAGAIMTAATTMHAKTIALVHNHPSGDICATHDDMRFVLRVHRAAISARKKLADFVILGPKAGYTSMAEEGILPGMV